jgi:hypothetical protein
MGGSLTTIHSPICQKEILDSTSKSGSNIEPPVLPNLDNIILRGLFPNDHQQSDFQSPTEQNKPIMSVEVEKEESRSELDEDISVFKRIVQEISKLDLYNSEEAIKPNPVTIEDVLEEFKSIRTLVETKRLRIRKNRERYRLTRLYSLDEIHDRLFRSGGEKSMF